MQANDEANTTKEKPFLFAKVFDRTWKNIVELYHVSGEYWVGYRTRGQTVEPGRSCKDFHAMFRLGVSGEVEALGLEVEKDLGRESWEERLIWFDRVEKKGEGS